MWKRSEGVVRKGEALEGWVRGRNRRVSECGQIGAWNEDGLEWKRWESGRKRGIWIHLFRE